MSLTILNNISSLTAENALSNTQTSLQKTLTQLSTGLRINSGADDAAGLSIADGLQANIAALTQSQLNASNGIGMLQTADGALSQVTSLLNRGVTLATEASNSTIDSSQAQALDTEFQSILSTINTIGSTTNFNGQSVFSNSSISLAMGDGTASGNMTVSKTIGALSDTTLNLSGTLGNATVSLNAVPTAGDTIAVGGTTYTFQAAGSIVGDTTANDVAIGANAAQTLQNLADAVNGVVTGANSEYSSTTNVNSQVSAGAVAGNDITFTSKVLAANGSAVTIASTGGVMAQIDGGSTISAGGGALNLLNTANAAAALTQLTAAISAVAQQRGDVGAAVNQLQSASNVMNTQVQNLQGADNSVMNADIGVTVANMTQYNVLQSTGMAALQQSNQAQQAVLKLVQ